MRALVVVVALALAACAAPAPRGAGLDQPVAAAPPTAPAPAPVTPEPPRQADALNRVVSELTELQNAMAKLMISARQHDEQLSYLTRRITELESVARGRAPQSGVPGFAPPAAMPAPLPPPPTAAPTAPPRSSAPGAPVAVAPPASPSPVPRPPAARPMSAADELYQAGLAKYQSGDLEGAVVSLYEVVSTYPNEPARERAQFLIGEIFVKQQDFRGAIAELESLIKAVPGSSRVPDSLLQIGLAQRALGEEARAKRTWERLVKEFPSSAPARQARSLMRTPAKS